jgi:hypothetical protein
MAGQEVIYKKSELAELLASEKANYQMVQHSKHHISIPTITPRIRSTTSRLKVPTLPAPA